MAYNAGTLLADIAFKLQNNPRYTQAVQLDGLNRAIIKLYEYALENVDVWSTMLPPDPQNPALFANEIPLPVGTYYVSQATYRDRPLTRMSSEQWVNTQISANLISTYSIVNGNQPFYYYVRNNQYLELYPRSSTSDVVKVYGLFAPPTLILPTDIPAIDPRYSDAAVAYATWWCLDSQTGEGDRAQAMYANYLAFRAEAKFNTTVSLAHTISRTR